MASIPNMRSTPLPVPAGKAGTAESAPGDFAAQLPVAGAQIVPIPARSQPGTDGAALVVPDIAGAIAAVEGEAPDAKAETGASETGETAGTNAPQPAEVVLPFPPTPTAEAVIPFQPTPPAVPGPQVIPTVAADETVPAPQAPVVQAPTARRGRTAMPDKAARPLPGVAAPSEATIDPAKSESLQLEPQLIEAAVKDLLQRKQVLPKPAGPAPNGAPAARTDPEATVTAPTPAPAAPQPAASMPVAAAVTPTMSEQLQPLPAASPAQPGPLQAEAPRTVEGTRIADIAVERQLDLARDGEWLDRLAHDIARAGAADTPLRFRLHPQTLGHLQVELQQGDHGTAVRLTVETEAARQLLADAQPRLAAEARAQGVRIAETHVDLSGSGRHAPGDQRRQDEARQNNLIRTARDAGTEAVASARMSRRDRLDRYA